MTSLFSVQACNNAWSNHRLARACLDLPPRELTRERPAFFKTIIATLNHIYTVDVFYVSALEGQCTGPSAFEPLIPWPDLPDLIEAQRRIDQRLIDLCDDTDLAKGPREIRLLRTSGIQTERFDRTFLHLIQHQIHHRGQVHDMLSDTPVNPPQLDEFYMAWDADRQLRAPDLKDLGLSEDRIWRGFASE